MASPSPQTARDAAEPVAGGILGARDWSTTGLGAPATWPLALRIAIGICERASVPAAIYWGEDLRLFHNEAWGAVVGESYRGEMGEPGRDVWGALWEKIEPGFRQVMESGRGAAVYEQVVPILRNGIEEEVVWNYSVTPIPDEEDQVRGLLVQGIDITKALQAERRLSFQVALADRLRGLADPEEVKSAATRLLGEHLGAARVGYAEIDEANDLVWVRSDWTREGAISLAGQRWPLADLGAEALAFLRTGQVLALPDIHVFPLGPRERSEAWRSIGVRALITVPLVRDGCLRALLYVHEPKVRRWKRSEAAIARDVAERTWAAVERVQAEQSLRDSEDHYRHTVELDPQVTWTALPDGQLKSVSKRWEDWTGTSGLGETWAQGLHEEDRAETFAVWARSVETGEPYDIEHRIKFRDGSYRWARSRAFPRRDEHGDICLWYGTTEDIHERKIAEERQRLLINELNHRVKNTLATVQAIAFQTLKGDVPVTEARARFEARLLALSRAHNLLTEENWEGAPLERIVEQSTEYLSGRQGCFTVEGPPLWLAPRAALGLALALHELGTNSAKYGALRNDEGSVAIKWVLDGDTLVLEWKERGGPAVEAPTRRGFGSRLIERGLESDLGGTAELRFEPDGLCCVIHASVGAVQAREESLG